MEFVYAQGIEAFNQIFKLLTHDEPKAVMVCIKILLSCKP
jgi:hypothetical protein